MELGEALEGVLLLIPWLIGIKHPKKKILCHTNTVILQTIAIIIDIVSTYLKKKQIGEIRYPIRKNSMVKGWQNFEIAE